MEQIHYTLGLLHLDFLGAGNGHSLDRIVSERAVGFVVLGNQQVPDVLVVDFHITHLDLHLELIQLEFFREDIVQTEVD